MAILEIRTFPDPVLKQMALPVEKFDSELEALANNMLDTMYDAPGVGLAANQVGILKRLFVLDVDYSIEGEDEDAHSLKRRYVRQNPRVMVNPEILNREGKILFKEGCLSVPGFTENVARFEKMEVKYQDLKGQVHTVKTEGLFAVAIQHEMDHLDGKLFFDRLSPVKKGLIKSKIKKERNARFERSRFHVEL